MAVFITVRAKGEAAKLKAAYDRIAEYEESRVPELGCHVCALTADGIFVSGTWTDRAAFERLMANPEFQALLASCDVGTPEVEIFEVYRSRHDAR